MSKWHVISIFQVCCIECNDVSKELWCPTSCIRPKYISQPTLIVHVHHIIESIILLLHSIKIITQCLSALFAKLKLSFLINKIPAIFLSRRKIFIAPISTTKDLKFLLVHITALSFKTNLICAKESIFLWHLKNLILLAIISWLCFNRTLLKNHFPSTDKHCTNPGFTLSSNYFRNWLHSFTFSFSWSVLTNTCKDSVIDTTTFFLTLIFTTTKTSILSIFFNSRSEVLLKN